MTRIITLKKENKKEQVNTLIQSDRTVRDVFIEACNKSLEYGLSDPYIGLIVPEGVMPLKVKEVLKDGFIDDRNTTFRFIPFITLTQEMIEKIKEDTGIKVN